MSGSENNAAHISRAWQQYLVKAVLDPKANDWPVHSPSEIHADADNLNRSYECQLFALPAPIAMFNDVKRILTVSAEGKELRIYPPFPLNEKKDASGSFEEVTIPEGVESVENVTSIPTDAVSGVRAQHGLVSNAIWARGLRIDVQSGADVQSAIRLLLDHICQYTQQWWVRGTHNPFLGFQRIGAAVDKKFFTKRLFGYKGATKIESPWYGTVRFQPALGSAAVLNKSTWSQISTHLSQGHHADLGILGIHEAFADYMAGRDDKCILNLCISIEILLNKHWQAVLKNPSNDKLEKIVRKTPLLDEGTKETLSKLMIDRGHVAHGRAPYIIGTSSKYTIETYVLAGKLILEKYLASIPQGAWPELMTMRINRSNG
jgi:hypothetical protein